MCILLIKSWTYTSSFPPVKHSYFIAVDSFEDGWGSGQEANFGRALWIAL